MREITFDLHGPGWTPTIILQLGEVLAELLNVFSKSSKDFGSCSLLPFEISVPPNSSPVTSWPYRINPPTAKKVDAVLDNRRGPHPAFDITMGEPSGCHPQEIR